jgi:hypothetical protein
MRGVNALTALTDDGLRQILTASSVRSSAQSRLHECQRKYGHKQTADQREVEVQVAGL